MMFAFESSTASVPIHYRVKPLQHIFCISLRKKCNLIIWHLKGSSDALNIHVVESFFLFYQCSVGEAVSVMGGTEEAFRSICRFLFKGVVGNKHGLNIGKQVYIWQGKEFS